MQTKSWCGQWRVECTKCECVMRAICMSTYTCIYNYTYIYTVCMCVYVCIHVCMYVCMHACMHACIYIYICISYECVCASICLIHTHLYAKMNTCMLYVRVYIYIYQDSTMKWGFRHWNVLESQSLLFGWWVSFKWWPTSPL